MIIYDYEYEYELKLDLRNKEIIFDICNENRYEEEFAKYLLILNNNQSHSTSSVDYYLKLISKNLI